MVSESQTGRISPADLRRMAEAKVADAESAELQGEDETARRLLQHAAGLELQAFAEFTQSDVEGRNLSGVSAIGISYQAGDFQTVVEKGALVLEVLGHAARPESRAQIQEMMVKAQSQLAPAPESQP